MKKGENKIRTDFEKMKHFARLVYAMRMAQKRVAVYQEYDKPERKAEAVRTAGEYEKCVDHMTEMILAR